jgi:hypothetical protein
MVEASELLQVYGFVKLKNNKLSKKIRAHRVQK